MSLSIGAARQSLAGSVSCGVLPGNTLDAPPPYSIRSRPTRPRVHSCLPTGQMMDLAGLNGRTLELPSNPGWRRVKLALVKVNIVNAMTRDLSSRIKSNPRLRESIRIELRERKEREAIERYGPGGGTLQANNAPPLLCFHSLLSAVQMPRIMQSASWYTRR